MWSTPIQVSKTGPNRIWKSGLKIWEKEIFFSTILVPTETVVELVKGKRKTSQRKIFPGYILGENGNERRDVHIVKDTPKITVLRATGLSLSPSQREKLKKFLSQMKDGVFQSKAQSFFQRWG